MSVLFQKDPDLRETLLGHIHNAAKLLDKAHMIRYDEQTGDLMPTDIGRTASYFYINVITIETFNGITTTDMTEADIINMMCLASEFCQIQVSADAHA